MVINFPAFFLLQMEEREKCSSCWQWHLCLLVQQISHRFSRSRLNFSSPPLDWDFPNEFSLHSSRISSSARYVRCAWKSVIMSSDMRGELRSLWLSSPTTWKKGFTLAAKERERELTWKFSNNSSQFCFYFFEHIFFDFIHSAASLLVLAWTFFLFLVCFRFNVNALSKPHVFWSSMSCEFVCVWNLALSGEDEVFLIREERRFDNTRADKWKIRRI